MYSAVYQIYRGGLKLPRKKSAAALSTDGSTTGDTRKLHPVIVARVFQELTNQIDVLPPMMAADVKIGRGGIMISGPLETGEVQRWWCVLATYDSGHAATAANLYSKRKG